MHNPTYKHLDAKLRLGGLRLGQWLQLALAGGFAVIFGMYLSPLPPGPTIALSVFAGGLPVAVSFAALGLEFSVAGFLRALVRWARAPRRYLPGPGSSATGYVVAAAPRSGEHERAGDVAARSRIAELWDY
jgi:hypothetical protein